MSDRCYNHAHNGAEWAAACHDSQGKEVPPCVDLVVSFKLLESDAKAPTKANPTDSGWDLYAQETYGLAPGTTTNVYTGVAVATPPGWGYSLRGRSSLNKKGIHTLYGTIDAGYTGKLYALLFNGSDRPYVITKGDRVGQMVFERVPEVRMVKVKDFVLAPGARGEKGFGSSGI